MTKIDDTKFAEIKEYWTDHGRRETGADARPPKKRDEFLQTVIESHMARWLTKDSRAADFGCGDGRSTLVFAEKVRDIVGFDYIAERIEKAERNRAAAGVKNAKFSVGDVLNADSVCKDFERFDTVTVIRLLINLPSWDLQAKAIGQLARIVRPGGLFLISEGWTEGVDGINRLRARCGMAPMTIVPNNLFISKKTLELECAKYFRLVTCQNLGFYYFMSRMFQPAFTAPEPPQHDHHINETAARLTLAGVGQNTFEDCDYGGVYVFERLEG
jgi:SAM-dependent methyltransferase